MKNPSSGLTILFFCLFFIIGIQRAGAGVCGLRADENVELMSVLARLADYPEYCVTEQSYAAAVDSCFIAYKGHPAVLFMKEIRKENGVMYDAVMDMAVLLEKQDGKLILTDGAESGLDSRWGGVNVGHFLSLLNRFYQDSDFHSFFESRQPFYEEVLELFRNTEMARFNEEWYKDFYGYESQDIFTIVIGFVNGYCSYGSSKCLHDNKREVFSIIGYDRNFGEGWYTPTIVHEFNHSFINPTVEKNLQVLESPCERLYQFVSSRMKAQAYGHWSTLTYESLVRAAEICYRMDNGYSDKEIQDALMNEINRGFWWTPELVVLLRKYERKKEKYGSFDDFFPQLVRFFERQADKECRRMQKAIDSQYVK